MADGVFPGLQETLPETHLIHQEEQRAPLLLEGFEKIAILERVGPGSAAGEIIDRGGNYLHQVGKGLPHPQIEVEGHLRG